MGGGITRIVQEVGNRHFLGLQMHGGVWIEIVEDPGTYGAATGHHADPGGRTVRRGRVAIGEAHAFRSEAVHVGC